MEQNKNTVYITWALRILVAALFLFSAYAKMYKLWAFEKQLVDLGLVSWCQSHYLARFLIGLEGAIGLALLQNNYLKTVVIPGTILLLVLFNVHLSIEMAKHGAMNGNCGCFGELVKMTPLEAFIKNVITIGILVYLFFKVKDREKGQNRIIYPFALFFACTALMFIIYPFSPCGASASPYAGELPTATEQPLPTTTSEGDTLVAGSDVITTGPATTTIDLPKNKNTGEKATTSAPISKTTRKATTATSTPVTTTAQAPAVRSRFGQFTKFGNTTANLDQGRKIVCMFAPGCDHCRHTAKLLAEMMNNPNFPPLYILFMDEESFKIPEFFQETKANFPYTILDIPTFWETMGPDASTPGVYLLDNGKVTKYYQGIEDQEFKPEEFKKLLGFN